MIVDEAYGQFAPWSALELRGPAQPGLVVTRTFSKTWAMAGARLGYLVADPRSWRPARRSCCRTTSRPRRRLAGLLALRHVPEMEARVASIAEERGRVAAALADLPVDTWPSDANFILFRPLDRDADEVWRACWRTRCYPQLCQLGRPARLPACHHRHARGERPFPACAEGEPVTTDPARAASKRAAPTKETTIAATLVVDGTGRTEVSTGLPFFDHMVEQLGPPRLLRPHRRTRRATCTSTRTTRSRTSASSSAAAWPRRLGDKAGVRRFASMLVAARRGADRGGARPLGPSRILAYGLDFAPDTPGLGSPPFNPQLAEEFWRAFVTAAERDAAHPVPRGQEHAPHAGGELQGRGPLPARRRARRGRWHPLDEGEPVTAVRASPSSTTASATCDRPRRRSNMSARTRGS